MTRPIYYQADLTQADLTQGRLDLHSGSVVECLTGDKHAAVRASLASLRCGP